MAPRKQRPYAVCNHCNAAWRYYWQISRDDEKSCKCGKPWPQQVLKAVARMKQPNADKPASPETDGDAKTPPWRSGNAKPNSRAPQKPPETDYADMLKKLQLAATSGEIKVQGIEFVGEISVEAEKVATDDPQRDLEKMNASFQQKLAQSKKARANCTSLSKEILDRRKALTARESHLQEALAEVAAIDAELDTFVVELTQKYEKLSEVRAQTLAEGNAATGNAVAAAPGAMDVDPAPPPKPEQTREEKEAWRLLTPVISSSFKALSSEHPPDAEQVEQVSLQLGKELTVILQRIAASSKPVIIEEVGTEPPPTALPTQPTEDSSNQITLFQFGTGQPSQAAASSMLPAAGLLALPPPAAHAAAANDAAARAAKAAGELASTCAKQLADHRNRLDLPSLPSGEPKTRDRSRSGHSSHDDFEPALSGSGGSATA